MIDFLDKLPHDPRCRFSKMERGDPTAFLQMEVHYICPPCAKKQLDGQKWCPNCKKWYIPKYPTKAQVPQHDKEAKEQWNTGLCTTKCWKEYLG